MGTAPPATACLREVLAAVSRATARVYVLHPTRPAPPDATQPPLYPPGHHVFFELAICFAGEMNLVGDAGTIRLQAGDAVVVRPGAWHYESYRRVRQPYRMCWLMAMPQGVICLFSEYRRGWFQTTEYAARPLLEEARYLQQLAREVDERAAHWPSKARAILVELLVDFDRSVQGGEPVPRSPESDPVRKLLRIVQTRFREPLQIKSLAGEIGLSADHLSRRFHVSCGTTFKDYLNSIRIHHAEHLLKAGWSIKKTADECGFSDVYYFNRVFTERRQMTPGRFVRETRRG